MGPFKAALSHRTKNELAYQDEEFFMLLIGPGIVSFLDTLASLRVDIFREYPYLYKGNTDNELSYLRIYTTSPEAVLITVNHAESLAGAVTAIPLKDEMEELTAPFAGSDYPVDKIFYIGELLFYPSYRNKGLGTQLLETVERHVRSTGNYTHLTCATVVRPYDHPQRPEAYVHIDHFLHRNRFVPLPTVTTSIVWQELDGISRDHTMQFWIKELS
jgi:GNAT superfamily N-acetyltransferase